MSHLYDDEPGRKEGWTYKKAIRGWWKDSLFEVFEVINDVHQTHSIEGNVGEIGTWYGRSFLALRNCINENELAIGVDVFSKNQKQEVHQHIKRCFGSLEKSIILEGNSQSPTVVKNLQQFAPFRLFYIDGGHTFREAFTDLKTTKSILAEGGVMFLDDYKNHNFGNDVSKAIRQFIADTDYVVAFTTCYQAFLCTQDMVPIYTEAMNSLGWTQTNEPVFNVPNYEHPLGANSWRR
jgi:hypothetical protein